MVQSTVSELDQVDVVEYLASKGVRVHRAAGDEVTAQCFFCNSSSNQRGKGKLYINTVEGLYHCKVCNEMGNLRTLMRHFGDEPSKTVQDARGNRRHVLECATTVGEQMLRANDAIIEYLLGRGLSAETIVEARIGYVPKGWSLSGSIPGSSHEELRAVGLITAGGHEFYENRITIPYLSRGAVVQLRGKDPQGKYFTAAGDSVRLFNADALSDAQDVIITEGEFDCLVLQQHLRTCPDARLRRIAVVGVAGAGSLPANFESYFTNARRVYVGFDPDDAGRRGALKVKELLGPKASILELPEDLPKADWTELFSRRGWTWKNVADLLAESASKRLFTMAEAGRSWRKQRATTPGLKTGFTELDATIMPGLLPGQVVVWIANTGVGKTLFGCNVIYNTRGHRHLFLSLEMTKEEVYERMRWIYQFHHPHATDDEIDRAYENVIICEENRLSVEDVNRLIEEYTDIKGEQPEVVTVDYLGYFARGVRGKDQYERTSEAVMRLKELAKAHKVVMLVPHQVNRGVKDGQAILDASAARDSGVVEETGDFVFSLYRPDEALTVMDDKNGRLCLHVLKSRHGGKGRTFTFVFAQASLAIVDKAGKAARKADDENYMLQRGEDPASVRAKHRQPVQTAMVYRAPAEDQ